MINRHTPQEMVLNKIKTLENQIHTMQTQVRSYNNHFMLPIPYFLAR